MVNAVSMFTCWLACLGAEVSDRDASCFNIGAERGLTNRVLPFWYHSLRICRLHFARENIAKYRKRKGEIAGSQNGEVN